MQEYITIVHVLGLTLGQCFLGYLACKKVEAFFPVEFHNSRLESASYIPFVWLLGLLLHLSLLFLIKILGGSWWLAVFLPLLPLFILWRETFFYLCRVCRIEVIGKVVRFPFLIWLGFHLFLGTSLFSVDEGVYTPWINNYGDLTFHLGMIHHFVVAAEFPPDYHLYAGEPLSYPFFVNLWSASLWLPSQSLTTLTGIFSLQWVLLWSCVYVFIGAQRTSFLAWVLVFGGGSYLAMVTHPGSYSWELINEQYPWSTWLSTLWVTQRSALMGLAVSLAACALVFNLPDFKSHRLWNTVLAAGFVGLSPLVHTHYFMVTALFLGAYLFFSACGKILVCDLQSARGFGRAIFSDNDCRRFWALLLPSLLALAFFPLLIGKSAMLDVILGWTVPLPKPGLSSLKASIVMWITNALPWFIAFGVIWRISHYPLALTLIAGLFLAANCFKLAVWEWDQIKVFLAVASLFIVVWAKAHGEWTYRWKTPASLGLALLLIGPGVYEAGRVWMYSGKYQVYDVGKLQLAEVIRQSVPAHAVIAIPPTHNSAATLTGRALFVGYPGTLASHNIAYREREAMHSNLERLRRCRWQTAGEICPHYLVWDASAAEYWRQTLPGEGFELVARTHDGRHRVYRISATGR